MKKVFIISSILVIGFCSCKKKEPEPIPVISPNGYTITGTNTVFGANFTLLTAHNWRFRIKEEYYADTLYSRVVLSDAPIDLAYFNFAKDGTMVLFPTYISETAGITNHRWFFIDNESKIGWTYLQAGTTTVSVQSFLIKITSDSLVLRRDFIVGNSTKKMYSRYVKY